MPDLPAQIKPSVPQQTLGLEPNIAAVLAYLVLLPPITPVVVLLLEKENRYVRFHAWQSLFLGLTSFLAIFTLETFASASSHFSHTIEVFFNAMILLAAGGSCILWLLLLIRSYQGVSVKLPLIGDEAARRVERE